MGTDQGPRRIYRSRRDRILGGVAGGVAAYLGVDPVLVRLAFVALTLAAGFGVMLYIVAWIIIPQEPEGGEPRPAEEARPSLGGRVVFGTILVALGILLLVDWFVPMQRVIWPLSLIVIGLGILAYGAKR